MSPQTSPTQIPAPQLSKRRQAVLILASYCSQIKKKASIETHRTDGKGGISSTLSSSCELKTDLDKLRVIENGSKQELRLLPISLSLTTINFCRVLTRRKKKKKSYWRWEVQPVLIHFVHEAECRRCSEHRGTVAT